MRGCWLNRVVAIVASAAACALPGSPLAAQTANLAPPTGPVNIVVAQDGSGQFKTIQEAIMSVPAGTPQYPVVIRIKPGTYTELIYVQREKRYFRLIGEDANTTIITHELHANLIGLDGRPIGTFRTPTVIIDADEFLAENLTFENAAGPKGQALALRVDGDKVAFKKCRFLGWQDTIFLNRGRHYFEDCYITGHVDFIFGGATVYFQRCHIHARGNGYLTAASTPVERPHGFVFSHCQITGEPGVTTYLGRPWRDHSATTFVFTEMSSVVKPEGWHNWDRPEREETSRYAEYGSTGEGGAMGARVAWTKPLNETEARRLTADAVLGGPDNWRAW
jgi:pectinesterase